MVCDCRALGLFTSGLLAGLGLTTTIAVVPALKACSDPLPAWKRLYKNGSKTAITLIFLTSGLALMSLVNFGDVRYLLVTGVTLAIAPFTVMKMKSTNDALFAIKDNEYRLDKQKEAKVMALISKWDKLQYVRTGLGFLGFALNLWIVCKP